MATLGEGLPDRDRKVDIDVLGQRDEHVADRRDDEARIRTDDRRQPVRREDERGRPALGLHHGHPAVLEGDRLDPRRLIDGSTAQVLERRPQEGGRIDAPPVDERLRHVRPRRPDVDPEPRPDARRHVQVDGCGLGRERVGDALEQRQDPRGELVPRSAHVDRTERVDGPPQDDRIHLAAERPQPQVLPPPGVALPSRPALGLGVLRVAARLDRFHARILPGDA